MTALSTTSPQAATSQIRASRAATLAIGFLASISGLIPAAFVLLTM
ncbi:MAG: hypothetical protein L0I76_06280 [Pseudonocardia sp.]|nr:hypothetical protein [Pseudonocardia sp.]